MATDGDSAPLTDKPATALLLRGWRQRALLTQEQLAQRTGLSVRTIGRLEAGRLRPRSGSVRLLAKALGLSDAEQARLASAHGHPDEPEPSSGSGPVPRQLPAEGAGFVGRRQHLGELDAQLTRRGTPAAVIISAIAGTAGVGKTALAVHWARQVADRFPDGQLYIDLHGYAPGPPVSPVQALALLLGGLGVEAGRIPVEPDEAAGLYRSLVAGRRMLVLLDNARDARQVRPLLPGDPDCLVVITSRDRLTGLIASHGAQRLVLDVLRPEEAVRLLARIVGAGRVAAEQAATAELARLCGYLPLALRIAAANLAGQPDQPIASYVAKLAERDRVAGLEVDGDPEAGVRTAFDCSYEALDPSARRLFRLLGLVPGQTFGAPAAAALSGSTVERAERILERLAGAHLLEVRHPGRYSFHDLLRQYARQRAEQDDDQPDREAALERLVGWYVLGADAGARLLSPHVARLPVPEPKDGLPAVGFDDHTGARAWLDAEWSNLVAAVTHAAEQGPKPLAWLLADTLRGYLALHSRTMDWLGVARASLSATNETGDLSAKAAASLNLGMALVSQGRYREGVEHLTTALALARRVGWVDGQAAIVNNLGTTHWETGDLQQAADYHTEGLALYGQIGSQRGEAAVLVNLGNIQRELGRLSQAADYDLRALSLHCQLGSRTGEAIALNNLGEVEHDLGRLDPASDHLTQALSLHREIGNRLGEAYALHALAAVHRDAGRYARALELAQAAVSLARESGERRVQAEALNTLGSVHLCLGDAKAAIANHHQALDRAHQTGTRYPETVALLDLAAAYQRQGHHDQAAQHAQQALALASKAAYRVLEGRAHWILASADHACGHHDRAVDHARKAVALHRASGHRLGEARALVALGHAIGGGEGQETPLDCWRKALKILSDIGVPEADHIRAQLEAR